MYKPLMELIDRLWHSSSASFRCSLPGSVLINSLLSPQEGDSNFGILIKGIGYFNLGITERLI